MYTCIYKNVYNQGCTSKCTHPLTDTELTPDQEKEMNSHPFKTPCI